MGKFIMSHSSNDKLTTVEKLERLYEQPQIEIVKEKEQCELLHCDGHQVDLSPYIKKEDIVDHSPLFQNYENRILLLNNKYDILINDHKEANLSLNSFSGKLDILFNKTQSIEAKIDKNSSMVDIEMSNINDRLQMNLDTLNKDLETINNKLEVKENKLEKYMPVIQVMVAVLLSILIMKSF